MNEAKEFLGKTLDAAIAEACTYYDTGREQLEIEIIEDAKSGIFGLVGARKAKIMARRAELANLLQEPKSQTSKKEGKGPDQDRASGEAKPDKPGKAETRKAESRKSESGKKDLPKPDKAQAESRSSSEIAPQERQAAEARAKQTPPKKDPVSEKKIEVQDQKTAPKKPGRATAGKTKKTPPKPGQPAPTQDDSADSDTLDNAFPKINLLELDQARLEQCCREIMLRLVKDMADDVEVKVNISQDRVQIRFECEDSGLLIGREGQNLSAIQYLGARMISRAMDAQIKIQVDAGDYQNRQDQRLQEMALALAQRVRTGGRSASTKPMSAYQRRIIHLTLQDEPDLQTRSSGEGALKRVVVMKRKDN